MPLTLFIIALFFSAASAQNLQERPLQKLIDCPTAGNPQHRTYQLDMRFFPSGGLLLGVEVGLFPRVNLGLSYGGSDIIGYTSPRWYPQPGIIASYRLINESRLLPALGLGYTNQGYGKWLEDDNRYQYPAKGFYAALGKFFIINPLGEWGFHAGTNYNPTEAAKRGLDVFTALEYRPNLQIDIIAEYSLALNDLKKESGIGRGRGYLNAGVRWSFARQLALDMYFRDLLINQREELRGGKQIGREVRIVYVESF